MERISCVLFLGLLAGVFIAGCSASHHNTSLAYSQTIDVNQRLAHLRSVMKSRGVAVYIILNGDDHQTKQHGPWDKRLEYISGFSGENGQGVVTQTTAVLWTESKYWDRADAELAGTDWTLCRTDFTGSPNMNQWIATHVKYTDKIASDPLKWEFNEWLNLDTYLRAHGLQLTMLTENLVDLIWYPKPSLPPGVVSIHPLEYAGEPWENKIQSMKDFMSSKAVDVMLISALDQIAWLLNLRGKDNPFSPLFKAYFVISTQLCVLYLPKNKITPVLRNYLGDIVIKPYDLVWTDLPEYTRTGKCIYLPEEANFLLYAWIPPLKLLTGPSPVKDLKAYKNSAEAKGMRNSQIKDALVWVRLVHRIEKEIESGEYWDELKVLDCVNQLRAEHWSYTGNSFPPTVAFGPHATDPEYRPTVATNVKIGDDILRVSYGSQYLDGTTKLNAILHCGVPTPLQRSVYTAILKGLVALVTTQFLPGSSLHRLEYLLEQPLLALALDYRPQRVHSIGQFLLAQEDFNSTLNINFFGVVEPEYLDSGIKLGQVIQVVPAYRERYMTMEVRSLFPFESRLIDTSQLDSHEIRWINEFHATVRYVIGEQLVGRGLHAEYRTLIKKTDPLV